MSVQTAAKQPAFRDPRPSVERIAQLAQRVLTADILLPRFQRSFVWDRKQVRELLDSIARNYPIGSVLLWQSSQELKSERSIAGLNIATARAGYPVNYLLDGQQRLSTICGALYWKPGGNPNSMWNLAYDLAREEFIHFQTLDEPPVAQIPLRYLSDPATFFRRVSAVDDEDLRDRADQLFNRFQDYMIAAVTLGDMSIDAVAPVFERINSTGTPLTIVDLMRAATWSPDFDLQEAIDGVKAVLARKGFGGVDRKTILRAISAAGGYGFSTESIDQLRTRSADQLKDIVALSEEGARRAVDFLTTQIGAPSAAALPYMNQMAVLIEIFRSIDRPDEKQYKAIHHWFWHTTLSGYFGGWNTGQMNADRQAIEQFRSEGSHLPAPAPLPRSEVWRVRQFRSNSAISKMLALLLSYQRPVDLLTGQFIDTDRALSWSNDKDFHHLFPKDFLRSKGVPFAKANAVANIVMLTSQSNLAISNRAPSNYLLELYDKIGDTLFERLDSCLVSKEACEAALDDDYDQFLRIRSEVLHAKALELVGEQEDESVQAVGADDAFPDEPSTAEV